MGSELASSPAACVGGCAVFLQRAALEGERRDRDDAVQEAEALQRVRVLLEDTRVCGRPAHPVCWPCTAGWWLRLGWRSQKVTELQNALHKSRDAHTRAMDTLRGKAKAAIAAAHKRARMAVQAASDAARAAQQAAAAAHKVDGLTKDASGDGVGDGASRSSSSEESVSDDVVQTRTVVSRLDASGTTDGWPATGAAPSPRQLFANPTTSHNRTDGPSSGGDGSGTGSVCGRRCRRRYA